jgi:hypothetical protein
MRIRLPRVTSPRSTEDESERRTLAEVSLYLDSITVYGYFLTWDQGTLVAGLLEGHIVLVLCSLRGKLSSVESTAQ